MRTARFWNNFHQVRSKYKCWKTNNLNVFGSNKTKGPKQDSLNESGIFLSMYLDHDLVKKTENKGEQKSKM